MITKYDYCKIFPYQNKFIVEYGHNTYKGKVLSSPIKIADRAFSSEKKALRFAKKIIPPEYIEKVKE